MAKTEQKEKVLSSLDIYLASFLALHGIQPQLKINNGRVTFNFVVTDKLYHVANEYNSNAPVPVADYVTQVKTLRGQMLTMRGQR